jgi:hypothetical protein
MSGWSSGEDARALNNKARRWFESGSRRLIILIKIISKMKFYECYMCEGVFNEPADWTEEERGAEYEQNFGNKYKNEETVLTCDECYKQIIDKEKIK